MFRSEKRVNSYESPLCKGGAEESPQTVYKLSQHAVCGFSRGMEREPIRKHSTMAFVHS